MNAIKTEALMNRLNDLLKLYWRYKEVAASRLMDINKELTEIDIELVDLETLLIEAEALGQETARKQLQKRETELLTKKSLFRQKQESATQEISSVIEKKLLSLIPDIPDAESESRSFERTRGEHLSQIDEQIAELKRQRQLVAAEPHPFRRCVYILSDLESAAGLEKGTVNHKINELKSPIKRKNPFFGILQGEGERK
ncbi:hypothetical protein [Gorillibacterium timonense]|uniref:hypothetical protein n=1 Tax=Gorillibacterium timonense TaxID=1689269 RepID=UPI00071D11CD|nr:hypothetical protein [Gorillibacterium timonense]